MRNDSPIGISLDDARKAYDAASSGTENNKKLLEEIIRLIDYGFSVAELEAIRDYLIEKIEVLKIRNALKSKDEFKAIHG